MFSKVITTIAVTVAVFILAAQTPDPSRGKSDGIAIPLTKRSDTDGEFQATSHDGKMIHGPSGMDGSERNTGTPHTFAVKRNGFGAGIGLTKFMDGIWYGTILIGTPPKPFTVQLNTGTSDLIVPASTGDENCRSHSNLWEPASSIPNTNLDLYMGPASHPITNVDLHIGFSAVFADGRSVSGKQYMDNVTIAGLTADAQTIGAATTCSPAMEVSKFAPDGILGLALPSNSGFHGQSPLFYTLLNERKLYQPMFSLKLTNPGGELCLGGTNTALYIQSTLVYTPVTSSILWQLNIDNIKLNNKIILTNVPAVIDTGANFIYGDLNRVLALHRAGGGVAIGNYFAFQCKFFPTVTFTIGGRPFEIPPKVLNRGRLERRSRSCFTGIVPLPDTDHTNFWSIGTLFLELFYTVFDFNDQSPRIGFAELQGGGAS